MSESKIVSMQEEVEKVVSRVMDAPPSDAEKQMLELSEKIDEMLDGVAPNIAREAVCLVVGEHVVKMGAGDLNPQHAMQRELDFIFKCAWDYVGIMGGKKRE